MKKFLSAALLASSMLVPVAAEAAFINGSITFVGGLDKALASSTIVSALTSITPNPVAGAVIGPTGVYVGTTSVNASSFSLLAPGGVIYSTGPAGDQYAFTISQVIGVTTDTTVGPGNLFTDSLEFEMRGTVTDLASVLQATPFIGQFTATGSCNFLSGACVAGTETAGYSVSLVSNDTLREVPAPASLALFGAALAGLAIARRRLS